MGKARDPADSESRAETPTARSTGESVRAAYFASPLYRLRLIGRSPDDLRLSPPNPWPANAARGRAIVEQSAVFAGEREPAGDRWIALDHSFGWLADLSAAGDDNARRRARQLVRAWTLAYGSRPVDDHWRPDRLGERICNCLIHSDFFCASADADYRALFLKSLARQARHLLRVLDQGPNDARRLSAIKGCLYAAVCLPGFDRMFEAGADRLDRELSRQILADGGHIERNPARQLAVLRDLIDVRAILVEARLAVPTSLQGAIDRMAPALRAMRHSDGGLALFNGGCASDAGLVDLALEVSGSRGRAMASLTHSGFQRLAAGASVVIADCGYPPPPGADGLAHAGSLAFEMSVGGDRLITNCGAPTGEDAEWREVCRTTAAHSTLIVNDTNSSELVPGGGVGRRPANISCSRAEEAGAILVESSHDGYQPRYGLVHTRRLWMSADGSEVRGEDTLTGNEINRFTVRFHLHPAVEVARAPAADTVDLGLPSGERWKMRVSGGKPGLENSVFLGEAGRIQQSRQIAVTNRTDGAGTKLRWRIARA